MVKFLIAAFAIIVSAHVCVAQSAFKLTVKDESTKEPIIGATVTVKDSGISGSTDAGGVVQLNNIPDGEQTIIIFSPGYDSKELKFTFPLAGQTEKEIFIAVTNEVGEVT